MGHTLRVQSEGWETVQLVKISPPKHQSRSSTTHYAPESHVWWRMLVTPTLGRWRQEYPWGSLASQPNLLGELLAVSNYLKKTMSSGAVLYSALTPSIIWLRGCRLSHRLGEGHSLISVQIYHLERAHLQRSQAVATGNPAALLTS